MCWKWAPFASRQDWTQRAPYFGKFLPVYPLSLPEFLRWCLLSRHLWFVVCFGKLFPSDIPIRNNKAASDHASIAAKVPSKWHRHQKRTEFRPYWCVNCGMSLHPAGNIQMRVPHRPIDLQRCSRFPYMQLLWWLHQRWWDQLCAARTSHTKHQSSLNEGFIMYHVGIFTCLNMGILRINISRRVIPRLIREPSIIQNARIFLKECLTPSTVCHSFHLVRLF